MLGFCFEGLNSYKIRVNINMHKITVGNEPLMTMMKWSVSLIITLPEV